MAKYNLNEVLKERERLKNSQKQNENADEPLALDDVSRVKVLSPGRQVFKRFVRNRLAVTGSVILIIMFIFSFIGPLFYPYGQKQIFYRYDTMNVNYALAKLNTAYNGYDIDTEIPLERKVVNAMNSNIKKMISGDLDSLVVIGEENSYLINKTADNIYTLSQVESTQVASAGNSSVKVGTFSMIAKDLAFDGNAIPGLANAAAENVKGNGGSFTFNGVEYTFEKGSAPKTFDIYAKQDGIVYTGAELGDEFEDALNAAVENGSTSGFTADGVEYVLDKQGSRFDVYTTGDQNLARIYTSYTVDTFKVGEKISDEFRVNALMAIENSDSFQADGTKYRIVKEENEWIVYDASEKEFAEFNLFSVRRYSGEDTMEYGLKKAVSAKIEELLETGTKAGTLMYEIPQQNEDGSYMRDENGNYIMNETEMTITQRLEGEYVINCDQINYVIDTFSPPTRQHIIGTDGDGFDMLARIMYGGRVSLMVGFVVVIIETVLGVIMGGLAGYFGGWVDNLIMRLVDIFYCLPSLPIMIILGAMMDAMRLDPYKRLMVMMAVLGVLGWAGVARLVRGQILSLREQEFMVATEATGIRIKDRIFKHLIPNVMPQLIVTATMGLGSVILTESTLSFLGLGVKHPLATWGTIINSVSSASAIAHYAFIWIPVGMLICLTVIAFNFVGDGLRDAYDPKAKR